MKYIQVINYTYKHTFSPYIPTSQTYKQTYIQAFIHHRGIGERGRGGREGGKRGRENSLYMLSKCTHTKRPVNIFPNTLRLCSSCVRLISNENQDHYMRQRLYRQVGGW